MSVLKYLLNCHVICIYVHIGIGDSQRASLLGFLKGLYSSDIRGGLDGWFEHRISVTQQIVLHLMSEIPDFISAAAHDLLP